MPQQVVTLKLPNGEEVSAPIGLWFLAYTTVMDRKIRLEMIEALVKIKNDHLAHNIIFNPRAGVPGVDLSGGLRVASEPMTGSPTSENPTGKEVHTDFTVDKKGKKHYRMFCDKGNYTGIF